MEVTHDSFSLRSPTLDLHELNEDGELWMAYESLKETNRWNKKDSLMYTNLHTPSKTSNFLLETSFYIGKQRG